MKAEENYENSLYTESVQNLKAAVFDVVSSIQLKSSALEANGVAVDRKNEIINDVLRHSSALISSIENLGALDLNIRDFSKIEVVAKEKIEETNNEQINRAVGDEIVDEDVSDNPMSYADENVEVDGVSEDLSNNEVAYSDEDEYEKNVADENRDGNGFIDTDVNEVMIKDDEISDGGVEKKPNDNEISYSDENEVGEDNNEMVGEVSDSVLPNIEANYEESTSEPDVVEQEVDDTITTVNSDNVEENEINNENSLIIPSVEDASNVVIESVANPIEGAPVNDEMNVSDIPQVVSSISPVDVPIINEDTADNSAVLDSAKNVVSDVVTESADGNLTKYKRSSSDPVKVILVNVAQFGKLMESRGVQKSLIKYEENPVAVSSELTQIPGLSIPIVNQVMNDPTSQVVSSPPTSEETIEGMMEKANILYKEGKTAEAQAMYDQISSMNKALQEQNSSGIVHVKKAA